MRLTKIIIWVLFIPMILSCGKKNMEKNNASESIIQNNHFQEQPINHSESLDKQVFNILQILDSLNTKVVVTKNFMEMEKSNFFYFYLKWKAPRYGMFDWSKIEFIDYRYDDFQKAGENYRNGCLVIKTNGYADWDFLAIYLLSIQTETGYKIIEFRDDWLISSTIDWEIIQNVLNEMKIEYFNQGDIIELLYPMEYYKNEIIKYQDEFYGFNNLSMEITQIMNISQIIKIDNFIPNYLTFFVSWFNQKGYIYYLYIFGNSQNILNHYYCGEFVSFNNYKVLMEKLSGNILEYGAVAFGDYNNNGNNEIILYTFYKNIGNVFCVYEFNSNENKLEELCLVPVFINYDTPFPPVENIENGFKILEIIDNEYSDLAWNSYIWDVEKKKYTKE